MIFGASMIRNEIDDRSITQVITSPVDRRISYLGYYMALIIVLALSLLSVTVAGWAGYYLVFGISGDAVGLFMAYLAVILLGAFVYSSLFLVMGVVIEAADLPRADLRIHLGRVHRLHSRERSATSPSCTSCG